MATFEEILGRLTAIENPSDNRGVLTLLPLSGWEHGNGLVTGWEQAQRHIQQSSSEPPFPRSHRSPQNTERLSAQISGNFGGEPWASACCTAFSDAAEERAAILEYDAGLDRAEAERRALVMTTACPPCRCSAGGACI